MDDRIVQKTQDTLGKVIKKPPLTEKLLKKPPFRFLHDIMTSVIKTTGFMKGLFTDLELQSDNVKDKESKVAFLQKAIDIVSLATGKELSVKPSKIVAGHEPEKTNEFLQALASAVSKKSKNDELVQQVLNGKGAGSSSSKKEKDRDSSADRRERSSKKDRDEKKSSKDQEKSKDREGDKENRDESRRKRSEKRDSVDSGKPDKEKIKQEDDKPQKAEKSLRENGHPSTEAETKQDESDDDEDGQAAKIPRPASAKGSRRRQTREKDRSREREEERETKPAEEERPPPAQRRSARPSSARPAPPKPKAQKETVPEPEIRIGSGKPVTQVIVDDAQNSDDDDNFVVEEGGPPEAPPPQKLGDDADAENDGDHGGLVKKILETKKELEGGSQQPQAKKVEIEKPAMSDVARRKEREMVVKEVDALRTAIQTLTRSANPLGKIMDYVQEDMDSMQKELEKWKQENKEHALALKREQGVTESSIEPLKGQLAELDESIANQLVMIAASKANILRNDAKITKMLGSVTKS